MFSFLIQTGSALIEALISYFFFDKIFEKKTKPFIIFSVDVLLYLFGVAINIILSSPLVNTVYFAVLNILLCGLCFKAPRKIAVFYSILLDAFSNCLGFAIALTISSIFNESLTTIKSDEFVMLLEAVISRILYFLCTIFLGRFVNKNTDMVNFPKTFYFSPVVTIVSLVALWYISDYENFSELTNLIFSAIVLLLLVSTIFTFISYQSAEKREQNLYRLETEIMRANTDRNYYDILARQNENLTAYAHDVKNHLAAIKSINNDPDVEEYIVKMANELRTYTRVSHSGNKLFDVVIDKYVTECELRDIEFNFDVRLCNLKILNDFDLVAIVGNLMDNAVDAAEKSVDKKISLETDYRNSYEVLIITNSCDIPPNSFKGKLITSKDDKRSHGIGIRSVEKTLKTYSGDFDWEYDAMLKTFSAIVTVYDHKNE